LIHGEQTSYAPGTFSYAELVTSDADGAKGFYTSVFGWSYDDTPQAVAGKHSSESERRVLMAKNHGSSIKDDEQYEALRKQGESKEKAARIANSSRSSTAKKGGKSGSYDDWSKDDLVKRAKEIGIEGRSKMNKGELVDALRNH
jgi:hypothetical protein